MCSIVIGGDRCAVAVRIAGEVDRCEWPAVQTAVQACAESVEVPVTLDLRSVTFMSASVGVDFCRAVEALRRTQPSIVILSSRPVARLVGLLWTAEVITSDLARFIVGGDDHLHPIRPLSSQLITRLSATSRSTEAP